ncbi:hypothetical protein KZ810_16010 [Sphingomonas sp. RHCKR47]|uniref:hypothetical protein n=1 Tax=Sphingomonas citricola TaxID=2862498 RepID=UPI001CA5C234|nr:hypothetical protein [Sphingomonas citricola]MBW6525003.1 hypothetical protein [Sphingomonas citricola]
MIEARTSASLSPKDRVARAHQSFFYQFQQATESALCCDPLAAYTIEIVLPALFGVVRSIEDFRQKHLQPFGLQDATE